MIYVQNQPLSMNPTAAAEISDAGLNLKPNQAPSAVSNDFTSIRDMLAQLGIRAEHRSIQSDNFVSGSAGWQLTAGGSAQFRDITLYSNSANAITLDYGSNILLKEGGSIKFTSVVAPTACIATLIETAGNVDNGTHKYKVSYVNAFGETNLGAVSNTVTVDATHKQVALSAIPISPSGGITSRKIYRTKAGADSYFLLTTISNNTETTYTDNTADVNLGVEGTSRANTTAGLIIIDDEKVARFTYTNTFLGVDAGQATGEGRYNTAVGAFALYTNTTGGDNVAVGQRCMEYNTKGTGNTAVGQYALQYNTTGSYNIALGHVALIDVTTGNNNIGIGYNTLYEVDTGSGNIAIGYYAGKYEAGSDSFYINNQDRTNTAGDKSKSILYGVMAAAAANQKLTINGLFNLSVSKTPAAANAAGTAGDICWDAGYIYVAVADNSWKRVAIAAW